MGWIDGVSVEVGERGVTDGQIRFRVTKLQRVSPLLLVYGVLILGESVSVAADPSASAVHGLWKISACAVLIVGFYLALPSRESVTMTCHCLTVVQQRSGTRTIRWAEIESVATVRLWWLGGLRQIVIRETGGRLTRLPTPLGTFPGFAAKLEVIVRTWEAQRPPSARAQLILPPFGHYL